MTKSIPLSQGKIALVDDDDFEWLNQWKWTARKDCNTYYAVRMVHVGYKKQKGILMHRQILGLRNGDIRQPDHINRNGLDNRRENLRYATEAQNKANRRMMKNNTSGYRGVYWEDDRKKWRVTIRANGKIIRLGRFDDLIEAARAYDVAAQKYHGEFASLNFPS